MNKTKVIYLTDFSAEGIRKALAHLPKEEREQVEVYLNNLFRVPELNFEPIKKKNRKDRRRKL